MKKIVFYFFAMFVLLMSIFLLSVFAQKERTIDVGKTGIFHLDSSLRVGSVLLNHGMYQVRHQLEGGNHFVVFREVKMNKFGKGMRSQLGDEAAKIKCIVESVDEQNKKGTILVRRNSANEREAVEIWFKKETVKYILPKS